MRHPDWPELNPDDYEDIDIDDPDNPELTEEDFALARPLSEVLPELHAQFAGPGPILAMAVRSVTLDLDAEVVAAFEAQGPDWRDRMRAALTREAAGVSRHGS